MIYLTEEQIGPYGEGLKVVSLSLGILLLFTSLSAGCTYGASITGGIMFLLSIFLIALPFNVYITKW